MSDGLCYLLVLAISIAMIIHGFMQLLGRQLAGESDVAVVQRQIRGIGYLLLSQVVFILGMSLCVGLSSDALVKMIKSAKL